MLSLTTLSTSCAFLPTFFAWPVTRRTFSLTILRTSALANRAPSDVSMSNFCSPTSRSVCPATLQSPEPISASSCERKDEHTRWIRFDFLCGDSKDIKDLDGYLNHVSRHCRGRWHLSRNFKPPEAIFDAFENIYEDFLALRFIFNCLRALDVTKACTRE